MKSSKSMDKLARAVIGVKYQYSIAVSESYSMVPPPPYPPSCRFMRDYTETDYSVSITRKIKVWNDFVRSKYYA